MEIAPLFFVAIGILLLHNFKDNCSRPLVEFKIWNFRFLNIISFFFPVFLSCLQIVSMQFWINHCKILLKIKINSDSLKFQ